MRLLAIETSGPIASLALWEDGAVAREDSFVSGMTLCQELPGRIQSLLGQECAAQAGLEALAVSLGPGSFTSLRVGLALAKAVAHCLSIRIVGVPTPEVMAAGVVAEVYPETGDSGGPHIAVLQHARADEVYLTLFEGRMLAGLTVAAPLAEAAKRLQGWPAKIVCGDGVVRHREKLLPLIEGIDLAPEELHHPRAGILAEIAAGRLQDADPQGVFSLTPVYVMPSQAERAAAEKAQGAGA